MESHHEFLETLTIVLGTAAVTTVLFQRLRQPVVLGYLVAGMIVGPHVPFPLQADPKTVHTLSELGVILLMFSLGLEFSLRKLFRVGPKAGFVAVVQSSLMVWLGYVIAGLFGWTAREGLYAGGIIAISSTTIIVKAFEESKVQGKFKEMVFGVLIVEDLIAILLMTILTTLSSGESVSPRALAMTAGRLGAFLAALLTVGLLLVPRLIRFVVKLRRPETTAVAAVGICFFCALLASRFGYSVALGAFVAGSLIAESGEEKEVEHVIMPVRDVFGAIFFVSVGMLIDPRLIATNWVSVLVLTAAVVVGKITFVTTSSFLTGAGIRSRVQSGMSLAQIGEFSFIIAGLGITMGATRPFLYPVAVAVSAITTLLTPWLIRGAGPVARWVDDRLPETLQTFATLYSSWIEGIGKRPANPTAGAKIRRLLGVLALDAVGVAAIIIGAGHESGRLSAALSRRAGLSSQLVGALVLVAAALLIAPLLVGAVRTARQLGFVLAMESMPEADPEKLDLAAAPRKALIVMLQLAVVILVGTPILAVTQPFIPPFYGVVVLGALIVFLAIRFWRTATDLRGHVQAATQVIAEALAAQARKDATQGDAAHKDPPPLEELRAFLPGLGAPVTVQLVPGSHAVGKSLADLSLRGMTGATVLLVKGPNGEVKPPLPDEKLEENDLLALAGSEDAIAAATSLLVRGPELA